MKIFIDLDGTLVDIAPRHHLVYSECVALFNGVPLPLSDYWNLKRSDTKWKELLHLSKIDAGSERDFLTEFTRRIESIPMLEKDVLFPGVREALTKLLVENELVLVSLRRNHHNLVCQLNYLELNPYFSVILSGHSETKEGVLDKKSEVINGLGGYEPQSIVIGDTEADIAAAKKLHLTSIAVATGIRNKDVLRSLKPDYIIDSFAEVVQLV